MTEQTKKSILDLNQAFSVMFLASNFGRGEDLQN